MKNIENELEPTEPAKLDEVVFNLGISKSLLVSAPKEELEEMTTPNQPEQSMYGALPYFDNRPEIVGHLPQELQYFGLDLQVEDKSEVSKAAESILLFEMKAGFPLSRMSEEILAHYPDLGQEGKVVAIFGLAGAGKSTALDALKSVAGKNSIVIDSDRSRYNLLAKLVLEAEKERGFGADEVKNKGLIHNRISFPFYLMLDHVTSILKNRGYTVARAATLPYKKADFGFYIEHPDQIDPVVLANASEEEVQAAAKKLFERTNARVDGRDSYDWENAREVTKFEEMVDVTVQVPQVVHERFIKTIAREMTEGKYQTLHNPKANSVEDAKKFLVEQLQTSF